MSSRDISQFSSGIGNLERFLLNGSWQIFQLSGMTRKMTLAIAGLSLVPGKIMEKIMPRVLEKYLKDNAVIANMSL